MDLNNILLRDKIESLGFDTVYLEKPMSNLIDFNWKNILPKPPANTSQETKQELLLISKETLRRSKQDIELIHSIDLDLDSPFIKLLNKYRLFYPQRYIDLFYDIVHPVLINTKNYWNRPRPNQLAKLYNINIDLIVTDSIHTASYPSGHTVYSKLVANILKDIYPKIRSKELDAIVLETAKARIMQGVHYPSDNRASITFSDIMYKKLQPKLRKYYDDQI